MLCWRRKSLTKKKKREEERGFSSESEPQGEPVRASHRRVKARWLEINNDGVVVWSGGDGVVVWSGGDGGFSLFLLFQCSLSLTPILSLIVDVGFGLLWIFVVGLSYRCGLEIKIGSRDWRSTAMMDSLSFSHSDPLFLSLRFSLSNWMWVLVLVWIFCRFNPNCFASSSYFSIFFFILILLLGFQFLMEFAFHRELEFFLLGCLIYKVNNKGK